MVKKSTQESLLAEFTNIRNRVPNILTGIKAQRYIESLKYENEEQRNHSSSLWVYDAHIGTLEKISGLLVRKGDYETYELLAIARNIFENIVWLRLMHKDRDYGLVFYAHLLKGQRESCERFIAKVTDEAHLFDTAQAIDSEISQEVAAVYRKDVAEKVELNNLGEERSKRISELDNMIRREFSLYADQATFNGYSYQAHILRSKEIPRIQSQLNDISILNTTFFASLPSLISPRLQSLASNKWNWADRANEASMGKHYQFIYSFTSRLLHSTPLNIITDKALADTEVLLILDYIVITALDILDLVDGLSNSSGIKISMLDFD